MISTPMALLPQAADDAIKSLQDARLISSPCRGGKVMPASAAEIEKDQKGALMPEHADNDNRRRIKCIIVKLMRTASTRYI